MSKSMPQSSDSTPGKGGLREWFFPNCREVLRLHSDAMEQGIRAWQRPGFHLHLALCKWCRRYGEQVRFLRMASLAKSEKFHEPAPYQLTADARERFKRTLRAAGGS